MNILKAIVNHWDIITLILAAILYVRQIESGGKIFLVSTQKTGNQYTGRVNATDVHKV